MFQENEGRGRVKLRHHRPDDLTEGRARRHFRTDDQEPDPRVGPGRWGHRSPGRGHGRGFGGLGWIPRDFLGRGPAVRRGDVRAAILVLLAEKPMHGYEIIGQLGERSGGMWRPSAGSVYPTLQQLEDEGLVKAEERDGRKVHSLTEDGRTAAAEAGKSRAPWDVPGAEETMSLWALFRPLAAAVSQVSQVGSPEQVEKARTILIDARRQLYRLLAEDDQADEPVE